MVGHNSTSHIFSKMDTNSHTNQELEEETRRALESQNNALRPDKKLGRNGKYHQIINLYKIRIGAEGGETRFGLEPDKYINNLALKQYYLKKETQHHANKQTAKNTI